MKTVAVNATLYLKAYRKIFLYFLYVSPDFDTYWYRALQAMPLSKSKFREDRHLEGHTIFKKDKLNCALYSIFIGIRIKFDTRSAHKIY
jgi:hypothetical protein